MIESRKLQAYLRNSINNITFIELQEFSNEYLKNNIYLNCYKLAIGYISKYYELHCKSELFTQSCKKLSYRFKRIIGKYNKSGQIQKYNSNVYIKNRA